jgi:ribokinase
MSIEAPRIIVIGSLNVDLTTLIDRMPRPGETMFGREFHLGFGGKGGNQAAAARLCGADVAVVARVGDDLFGPATIDDLARLGIHTACVVKTAGAPSGVAPIFIDASGQNSILVVKGANDLLSTEDVDAAAAVIESADVLIMQFEIPLATVYYALDVAHRYGVRTIVNPAPAAQVDLSRLSKADYLIPNETEAEGLTGIGIRDLETARAGAMRLLDSGFKRVIITLGDNGALFSSEAESYHVPVFRVDPVDTSGAGDAFIGSFAFGIATGLTDREAIARANVYAALSTTKPGTRRSFPARAEWLQAIGGRT